MGKIRTLSNEEAAYLRSTILKVFREKTAKEFTPVTYLGAYEDLRGLILDGLDGFSGAGASVSLHRLRKLFYYTDPSICPPGRLEPLSFGDDFISLLYHFLQKSGKAPVEPGSDAYPVKVPVHGRSRTLIYFISFFFLALLVYLSSVFYRGKPYFFRDDFHSNSVEDLKKRGWDIIDFDSSLFYPQDTGVLTLRSARGDYWVRPYDTPYIHNVVYRELPKGCFEVTTKFTFPNNFEAYQQCGIYILNKDKTRNHNIRMTYAQINRDTARGFQVVKRDYGEATQYVRRYIEGNDTFNHHFFIKLIRKKNQYDFYYHRNEENAAFEFLTSMTFDFDPKYIALASFNGYRVVDRGPLNTASSIPAKFDWVRVEGCE